MLVSDLIYGLRNQKVYCPQRDKGRAELNRWQNKFPRGKSKSHIGTSTGGRPVGIRWSIALRRQQALGAFLNSANSNTLRKTSAGDFAFDCRADQRGVAGD